MLAVGKRIHSLYCIVSLEYNSQVKQRRIQEDNNYLLYKLYYHIIII